MLSNFHTHTNYCDGTDSIGVIAEKAHALQLKSLGISSHAPLPFYRTWCMAQDSLSQYLEEIAHVRHVYPSLEIYAGLEIDFIPGVTGPSRFKHNLDYTLGAVHFVEALPDGTGWEIDGTYSHFCDGLSAIFANNIKEAVIRYFELTRTMIEKDCPDIIAHLDKIKMHNKQHGLFHENEFWYREEIKKTIDLIRQTGVMVEVNTRGLYQGKTTEPYPGLETLRYMHQQNIPITINSDAHHPDQLVKGFTETLHVLSSIGFREIMVLRDGQWKPCPIQDFGCELFPG